MPKSISILGTSHRPQGARKAESIRYIDDPSYRRYLEDQLRPKLFDFVFEEASECGPTIAEDVATTLLGQGHYLDVDPHPDNRASFGIPALRNSYTPIIPYEPGNGDFVQHEDLEGQEKREEPWVKRVKEQSFNWALFICGYLHSLSLLRIPDDADQRSGMKPITIPF
jgi:hypothetical protein